MEERAAPSAGGLDTSFGDGGKVLLYDNVNSLVGGMDNRAASLQSDGSMFVVGSITSVSDGMQMAVQHYTSAGALDTNFGTGGQTIVTFSGGVSRAYSAAVQADGKIVLVGTFTEAATNTTPQKTVFALARLNANGSLDATFGNNGLVIDDFGGNIDATAQDVKLTSDGHIVVAGTAANELIQGPAANNLFVLARYNSDGSLDTSFGNQGHAGYTAANAVESAKILLAPDNSILLVGQTHGLDNGDTLLLKFNQNGTLATGFGSNGIVHAGAWGAGIALQADGKILVASSTAHAIVGWNGPSDFLLTRYNSDGTIDSGFGANGIVVTHFATGDSQAFAVTLQPNGDILVGGTATNNALPAGPGADFGIVRYHDDGSLDTSFGAGGFVQIDYTNRDDALQQLMVDANGMVMAAGSSMQLNTADALAVTRIDGVGAPRRHLIAVGTDAPFVPEVRAYDAATGQLVFDQMVYNMNFTGGVRVATADVNGDGVDDIITAAGTGGGPHVKVFDGATGKLLMEFMAYDPHFTGGVYIAAADVNGDGKADIITGAGAGGGPHVEVFDGATGAPLQSYFAYDPAFTGGVRVAAGDLNGDGKADIITAAGPGGGPQIQVFDGVTGQSIQSFFAYDPAFTGGVYVAAGDVNGDGKVDIITGAGEGGGPNVKVFDGGTFNLLTTYFAFDSSYTGGVRVGAVDRTGDGKVDIVLAGGHAGLSLVRTYSPTTFDLVNQFYAFSPNYMGGTYVS
jgi:uncharacterized delta-60 repeat protein